MSVSCFGITQVHEWSLTTGTSYHKRFCLYLCYIFTNMFHAHCLLVGRFVHQVCIYSIDVLTGRGGKSGSVWTSRNCDLDLALLIITLCVIGKWVLRIVGLACKCWRLEVLIRVAAILLLWHKKAGKQLAACSRTVIFSSERITFTMDLVGQSGRRVFPTLKRWRRACANSTIDHAEM